MQRIKKLAFPVLATLGFVAAMVLSHAATTTLIGPLKVVNNTSSNLTSAVAGTITLPSSTYFLIQQAGLATTNALTAYVQLSVDNTNFLTVATYVPTATNAMMEQFTPGFSNQTIYFRVLAVTTNNVSVGAAIVSQ